MPTVIAMSAGGLFAVFQVLFKDKRTLAIFSSLAVLIGGAIYALFPMLRYYNLIGIGFLEKLKVGDRVIEYSLDHSHYWLSGFFQKTVTLIMYPANSFLDGNPHPFALSSLFVLFSFGAILLYFFSNNLKWSRKLFLSFTLAAAWLNQSWDVAILVPFLGLIIFIKNYRNLKDIKGVIKEGLIIFVPVLVFYLPFSINFQIPVSGLSPLPKSGTSMLDFFYAWGHYFLLIVPFTFLIIRRYNFRRTFRWWMVVVSAVLSLGPFISWFFAHILRFLKRGEDYRKVVNLVQDNMLVISPFIFLLFIVLLINIWFFSVYLAGKLHTKFENKLILFTLSILTLSFMVFNFIELFMIRDAIGTRFDTVFKFCYNLWHLLGIVAALSAYHLLKYYRGKLVYFLLILVGFVSFSLPTFAIDWEIDHRPGSVNLEPLAFLKDNEPEEYEAIQWIISNIPRDRIILEGREKYFQLPKVSTFTSHPTILGAVHLHENLYRPPGIDWGQIEDLVEDIYTSSDLRPSLQLLEENKVSYIYVGSFEEQQYGIQVRERFSEMELEVVFENEGVQIYKTPLDKDL